MAIGYFASGLMLGIASPAGAEEPDPRHDSSDGHVHDDEGHDEHDHGDEHDHDRDAEHEHLDDGDREHDHDHHPPHSEESGEEHGHGLELPDLAAVIIGGLYYFSDAPSVRVPAHEPTSAEGGIRFDLQEIEISIQSQLLEHLRADVFLGVALTGLWVEGAYLTVPDIPGGFEVRAGLFAHRFGHFNPHHFLSTQPFVDMPLVLRRFVGGEQLREIGIEASWKVPVPWSMVLTASLSTAGTQNSFGVGYAQTKKFTDLMTVGRLRQIFDLGSDWKLVWSVSGAQGPNVSGGLSVLRENRTVLAGSDLGLKWRHPTKARGWGVQAEYILRHSSVPDAVFTEGGFYVRTVARLSRFWELGVRYDYVGLPSRIEGKPGTLPASMAPFYTGERQWRAGAVLSLWITDFQRVRLQYAYDRFIGNPGRTVHEVFLQFHIVMGNHTHDSEATHEHYHDNHAH